MIAYLEGSLFKKEKDRIVLLVNHIGYEVLVPAFVMETLAKHNIHDELALYIYFHQTERTPRPVLIGFNHELEREFFELFISVETIGPLKAVKALNLPIAFIAGAIESGEGVKLKKLNGVGERMANKIIATLKGKTGRFGVPGKLNVGEDSTGERVEKDFTVQVINVLISKLGHKPIEAKEMVDAALKRNPLVSDPESLFEEIYRSHGLSHEGEK